MIVVVGRCRGDRVCNQGVLISRETMAVSSNSRIHDQSRRRVPFLPERPVRTICVLHIAVKEKKGGNAMVRTSRSVSIAGRAENKKKKILPRIQSSGEEEGRAQRTKVRLKGDRERRAMAKQAQEEEAQEGRLFTPNGNVCAPLV